MYQKKHSEILDAIFPIIHHTLAANFTNIHLALSSSGIINTSTVVQCEMLIQHKTKLLQGPDLIIHSNNCTKYF